MKIFYILVGILFLAGCSFINNESASHHTANNTPNAIFPPKHIALLLPMSGSMAGPGHAVRDGFMANVSNQYSVHIYDTTQGDIEQIYQQAIAEGADTIVGPLEKNAAQRIARLPIIPVTTLLLNYAIPPYSGAPHLYQLGLSPLDEATQVAQYAYAQGHRSALVIAPSGPWGNGVQAFRTQWEQLGGHVVAQFNYASNQDIGPYIHNLLQANDKAVTEETRRRQDVDMIFLMALPTKARQINPLLKFYYAGDLPVYATSLIYNGRYAPLYDQDLNGITFDDMPWIFNPEAAQLSRLPRLYALGMDAFTVIMHRNQWKNVPQSGIQGKTGMLFLKPGNQISRQLVWGQFQNGQAELLSSND